MKKIIGRRGRGRKRDPKIGKYGLASVAVRIKGTRTEIIRARSPVEIYCSRYHHRPLSIEPIGDGATFKASGETQIEGLRPFIAHRPQDGKEFLLLMTKDQNPQHVAQGFFRTDMEVELVPADPEDFRQQARQLHKSGVILDPKIRRYAGIT
jgi:hypothetical protein